MRLTTTDGLQVLVYLHLLATDRSHAHDVHAPRVPFPSAPTGTLGIVAAKDTKTMSKLVVVIRFLRLRIISPAWTVVTAV